MDANIAQLAHETKDLLAPFLPYLLPAAAEAGKAAGKLAMRSASDLTKSPSSRAGNARLIQPYRSAISAL
jgi:hypothetical protein